MHPGARTRPVAGGCAHRCEPVERPYADGRHPHEVRRFRNRWQVETTSEGTREVLFAGRRQVIRGHQPNEGQECARVACSLYVRRPVGFVDAEQRVSPPRTREQIIFIQELPQSETPRGPIAVVVEAQKNEIAPAAGISRRPRNEHRRLTDCPTHLHEPEWLAAIQAAFHHLVHGERSHGDDASRRGEFRVGLDGRADDDGVGAAHEVPIGGDDVRDRERRRHTENGEQS